MPNSLHLLHTKSWHVGKAENIARVKRDEAIKEQEDQSRRSREDQIQSNIRLDRLRKRAREEDGFQRNGCHNGGEVNYAGHQKERGIEEGQLRRRIEEGPNEGGQLSRVEKEDGQVRLIQQSSHHQLSDSSNKNFIASIPSKSLISGAPSLAESLSDTRRPWYSKSSSSSSTNNDSRHNGAPLLATGILSSKPRVLDMTQLSRASRDASLKHRDDPLTVVRKALAEKREAMGLPSRLG